MKHFNGESKMLKRMKTAGYGSYAEAGTAQRCGTPTASTARPSGSAITNSMATAAARHRT